MKEEKKEIEEEIIIEAPAPVKQTNANAIIMTILILLVLGLTSFIVYDKFIKDDIPEGGTIPKVSVPATTDEPTTPPATEKENELSIDSDIVKKLSKVVGAYKNNEISDYSNYFYKNDKVILAKEKIDFKLALTGTTIDKNLFKEDKNLNWDPENNKYGTSYISEDDVKNAYKELFGANNDYTRARFMVDCNDYKWSDENNRYESINGFGCGGASATRVLSKIASAKQLGNKIEIYEKILVEDPENYYADYNRKQVLESSSANLSEDALFTKYSDKASTYKYTFTKDANDIYVFTSVEKVK